jgi:putative ABC transport system substrate-binding protein
VYTPVTWIHRQQIRDLATRNRLPVVYWYRGYVLDGGLMSYEEDEREVPKRLAGYVDKVLRSAKPTDLPVEQPDRFELLPWIRVALLIRSIRTTTFDEVADS